MIKKIIVRVFLFVIHELFLNPKRKLRFYAINTRSILRRQVIFEKAPICYQDLRITGLGKVVIGNNCKFGFKLGGFHRNGCIELQARYSSSKINIGSHVTSNNNLFICCANEVVIGQKTLIGNFVSILDHEAHGNKPNERNQLGIIGKVTIGENVWIGNNVTILKNTTIGDNSIVAIGSVVSGEFPNNVIIGGIPAKIIKNL
jgi:acetyltransferase-like isoleucine patch superfamily enzyme